MEFTCVTNLGTNHLGVTVEYPLTVGKSYQVFGFKFVSGEFYFVLIADNDLPCFAGEHTLQSLDRRIPSSWLYDSELHAEMESDDSPQEIRIGIPPYVADEYFPHYLMERDDKAWRELARYLD